MSVQRPKANEHQFRLRVHPAFQKRQQLEHVQRSQSRWICPARPSRPSGPLHRDLNRLRQDRSQRADRRNDHLCPSRVRSISQTRICSQTNQWSNLWHHLAFSIGLAWYHPVQSNLCKLNLKLQGKRRQCPASLIPAVPTRCQSSEKNPFRAVTSLRLGRN